MSNSWYEHEKDCLRCDRTGHVPVLDYYEYCGKAITPRETLYLCGCKFTRKHFCMEEKIVVEDGKRRKTDIKKELGGYFDDVFGKTQFFWDEEIAYGYDPMIEYSTVYLASKIACLKNYHATKRPEILQIEHPLIVAGLMLRQKDEGRLGE
jgi:hypothetical protein